MYRIFTQILLVLLGLVAVISCEDDKYLSTQDAQLKFSADTIMFDTVFTKIGSTTRILKVFNPYKEKVLISKLKLGGGDLSNFRLNINGVVSNEAFDVEVPPRDSIFIFVEVTIDPNGQTMPMVVKDSIAITINSTVQNIPLIAWGQDFHLIRGTTLRNVIWTNDKPYLVYNYAFVDTLSTLTIEAGTKVFFHKGAGLYVKGTLLANGTRDNPIVFQADRLEDSYKNVPDQWNGILLFSGSKGNILNYSTIRNANIGLQVGTIEHQGFASVRIANTKIQNMAYAGIFALKSKIFAYNTLISNCGLYCAALLVGGEYEFYHTTIANYWGGYSRKARSSASLIISNKLVYTKQDGSSVYYLGDLTKAHFGNSIIYGNYPVEIELGADKDKTFNYFFDNCILQMPDTFNISNRNHYNNVLRGKNSDPKFVDIGVKMNFELDTLSPAKDVGSTVYSKMFPYDLKGADRSLDRGPDLGAFERIEKKSR